MFVVFAISIDGVVVSSVSNSLHHVVRELLSSVCATGLFYRRSKSIRHNMVWLITQLHRYQARVSAWPCAHTCTHTRMQRFRSTDPYFGRVANQIFWQCGWYYAWLGINKCSSAKFKKKKNGMAELLLTDSVAVIGHNENTFPSFKCVLSLA